MPAECAKGSYLSEGTCRSCFSSGPTCFPAGTESCSASQCVCNVSAVAAGAWGGGVGVSGCAWRERACPLLMHMLHCTHPLAISPTQPTNHLTTLPTLAQLTTPPPSQVYYEHGPLHRCEKGKSAKPPPSDNGGCFPAAARARLADGRELPLSALRAGDRVLAGVDAAGAPLFSEVYMWGHRDPRPNASFVQLTTAGGARLWLTPDHHLPVADDGEGTARGRDSQGEQPGRRAGRRGKECGLSSYMRACNRTSTGGCRLLWAPVPSSLPHLGPTASHPVRSRLGLTPRGARE